MLAGAHIPCKGTREWDGGGADNLNRSLGQGICASRTLPRGGDQADSPSPHHRLTYSSPTVS